MMGPSNGNFIEDKRTPSPKVLDPSVIDGGLFLNACALLCLQFAIGTGGVTLGAGIGIEAGISGGLSLEVGQRSGQAISVSCTAAGGGGGYGEIGLSEGGPFIGGGVGVGAEAGCGVMYSHTWTW